ncbi:hypothetical protein [Curtobacterium sp. MCBD17_030]|uniref:hypothetical protein n=1 Tax=Curtobacterium sp. MCBD17_030 TaxID=2175649 RepID=UPI0011B6321C|nr:hypothetical protein [Curtobacterium sp. MCBD17_030]
MNDFGQAAVITAVFLVWFGLLGGGLVIAATADRAWMRGIGIAMMVLFFAFWVFTFALKSVNA